MKVNFSVFALVTALSVTYVPGVNALTINQFYEICRSAPGDCSDHPIILAYVGGAVDLLATLDEKTDYLAQVYCKDPREIFDVPTIIQYMEQSGEPYGSENAMLVFMKYIKDRGGC
ncbi:MAG: hypothetical protein AAF353_08180 [Pseudomonadota bacterium]